MQEGIARQDGSSKPSRIANVVATTIALSGAIIASPDAVAKLPSALVVALRTTATLGHTLQPVVVTVLGVVVAAVTHPPHWLTAIGRGVRV